MATKLMAKNKTWALRAHSLLFYIHNGVPKLGSASD
jgi:hypothetical protein